MTKRHSFIRWLRAGGACGWAVNVAREFSSPQKFWEGLLSKDTLDFPSLIGRKNWACRLFTIVDDDTQKVK